MKPLPYLPGAAVQLCVYDNGRSEEEVEGAQPSLWLATYNQHDLTKGKMK